MFGNSRASRSWRGSREAIDGWHRGVTIHASGTVTRNSKPTCMGTYVIRATQSSSAPAAEKSRSTKSSAASAPGARRVVIAFRRRSTDEARQGVSNSFQLESTSFCQVDVVQRLPHRVNRINSSRQLREMAPAHATRPTSSRIGLSYRDPCHADEACTRATPQLHMTASNLRSNAICLWGFADDIFPCLASAAQRGAGAHEADDPRLEGHAGRKRGHEPRRRALERAGAGFRHTSKLTLQGLGVGRPEGNNSWPISWTTWVDSRRTCRISSARRLVRGDPRQGPEPISNRTAIPSQYRSL